jgi:hypothetical protein
MILAKPYYCFMKVLSYELGAFMMRRVDDRLSCHIMNSHRRPTSHVVQSTYVNGVGGFATICIHHKS